MSAIDLDSLEPGHSADPYELYGKLAATQPVARVRLRGLECWLVTGYEAVREALAHPALSNDTGNAGPAASAHPFVAAEAMLGFGRHMLRSDPPDHTRLRRLVELAFTQGRAQSMRPWLQATTDGLMARFLPRGQAELVEELGQPLAIAMIAELLGVPDDERAEFTGWARTTASTDMAQMQRIMAAYKSIRDYLGGLVDRRWAEPPVADPAAADLLRALVAVRDGEDRLDRDELLSMAYLLLAAGHRTTVYLVANGVLALLRHPDQLAALRADPALEPAAVEELLRYEGPVELNMRFTTAPVTIGGATLPGGGDPVLIAVASADRDPGRFDDPHRLDLGRPADGHLAFGNGVHQCLGAPLARLLARVTIRSLLDRCPDLRLDLDPGAEVDWLYSAHLRGPVRLPVRFTPVPTP